MALSSSIFCLQITSPVFHPFNVLLYVPYSTPQLINIPYIPLPKYYYFLQPEMYSPIPIYSAFETK